MRGGCCVHCGVRMSMRGEARGGDVRVPWPMCACVPGACVRPSVSACVCVCVCVRVAAQRCELNSAALGSLSIALRRGARNPTEKIRRKKSAASGGARRPMAAPAVCHFVRRAGGALVMLLCACVVLLWCSCDALGTRTSAGGPPFCLAGCCSSPRRRALATLCSPRTQCDTQHVMRCQAEFGKGTAPRCCC